jgi:hypothetical protein
MTARNCTERTAVLPVHSALQHFSDSPDLVQVLREWTYAYSPSHQTPSRRSA